MKRILLLIFGILFYQITCAQSAGDFQSHQTGNWNDVNTWERFDGSSWIYPAPNTPTNADGIITIQTNHTVTIPSSVTITADQIYVQMYGDLELASGGVLSLANGTGNDLIIYNDGLDNGFLNVAGRFEVTNDATAVEDDGGGGFITLTNITTTIATGGVYSHKYTTSTGAIIGANWLTGSTCEIAGYTSNSTAPSGLGQSFYNFTWNCPNQTSTIDLGGALTTVNGNLLISNTNTGQLRIYNAASGITINVGGNLTISNTSIVVFGGSGTGTLNLTGDFTYSSTSSSTFTSSGTNTYNFNGNFSLSAGTLRFATSLGGTATINLKKDFNFSGGTLFNGSSNGVAFNLTGSSLQNVTLGGALSTKFNFTAKSGSKINLGTSALIGTGNLTAESNSEIQVGSTDPSGAIQTGTTAGNIRVPGTRTYTSGCTITYNGAATQFIGNGHPSTSGVNTIINNSNGVTLASTTSIGGTLTLTNGNVSTGSNALTVSGNLVMTSGNISVGSSTLTLGGTITPGSNIISVTSSSSLVINGSGITGNFPFPSGAQTINNFTLNRGGGSLTMGQDLNINGTCTLTNGSLIFNGHTLTLNNTISSFNGDLSGNSSSKLKVTLDGPIGILPIATSTNIRTLSINGGASTTVSVGALNVDSLKLSSGALTNSGGLTMNNGGIVYRQPSGSLAVNALDVAAGQSYNIYYTSGSMSTGLELPDISSPSDLNNLTIDAGSGTVTLDKDFYVNGTVSLSTGTLSCSSFTIHVNGSNWTKGSGSFSAGSGVVSFERTAGTTIGGSGTPTFGNINLISTATLNLPSGSINVSGDLQISSGGVLNNNSGTVKFNGSVDQNVSAAGTNFYNITVNKTAGKVILGNGLNLVNTLTLQSATEFNSAGNLVILSTSDAAGGNARIASLATGASVTGSVTVQRYMSGEGRIYRYLSVPVNNAHVSDWMDDFPITGTFSDPSTGAGIVSTSPSLYYYDETVAGASANGWKAYPTSGLASANPLVVGRGYGAFIRLAASPTIVDVTGTINQGDINLNVTYTVTGDTSDGWNLVGNPYPATIDWDPSGGWTKTNVNGTIAVRDNGSVAGGKFQYWNGISGGLSGGTIATGQAFWVKTNGASPSLIVKEAAKTTTGVFFRKSNFVPDLLVAVLSDSIHTDEAYINFRADAHEGIDQAYDGYKLDNDIFNISSLTKWGSNLAINTLPLLSCDQAIRLKITNAKPGNYTLSIDSLNSFSSDFPVQLYDAYAKKTVDIRANHVYHFSVTSDSSSFGDKRFTLYLDASLIDQTQMPALEKNGYCSGESIPLTIENSQADYQYTVFSGNTMISDSVKGTGGPITLDANSNTLKAGDNTLTVKIAKPGCPASPLTSGASVFIDTLYSVSHVSGSTVCPGTSATLIASGAPVNGSYHWYDHIDSQEPMPESNADSLITPPVYKDTTFYVTAVNSLGCESAERTPVKVNIYKSERPLASATGGVVCVSGAADLTATGAPAGGGYLWFTADTAQAVWDSAEYHTPILNESASYYVSTVNPDGCRSSLKEVFVDVINIDTPFVSVEYNKAVVNLDSVISYQWYNAENDQPIPGATDNYYNIGYIGQHGIDDVYVVIKVKGCSFQSENVMRVTGLDKKLLDRLLQLYPNPAHDVLEIEYNRLSENNVSVYIYSINGRLVRTATLGIKNGAYYGEVNVKGLQPGLYFLKLLDGDTMFIKKFIKN